MAFIYLICCDKKAKKFAIIEDIQSRTNLCRKCTSIERDSRICFLIFSFPPKVCFDQTMISSYGLRWMNSKSKWIGWRIRNCNNARKQILDFSRNLRLTAWTCVAWISFSTSVPPQIQIQILMLRFRGSKKAFLVRSSVLWMQMCLILMFNFWLTYGSLQVTLVKCRNLGQTLCLGASVYFLKVNFYITVMCGFKMLHGKWLWWLENSVANKEYLSNII